MSLTTDFTIDQLKVLLLGISPMIWRRLLVRHESTIADLHHIPQITMGWTDTHRHRLANSDVTPHSVHTKSGSIAVRTPDSARFSPRRTAA